jgi:DNA-directed RNA polymerase subunit RPC12/RpoP
MADQCARCRREAPPEGTGERGDWEIAGRAAGEPLVCPGCLMTEDAETDEYDVLWLRRIEEEGECARCGELVREFPVAMENWAVLDDDLTCPDCLDPETHAQLVAQAATAGESVDDDDRIDGFLLSVFMSLARYRERFPE